ncbi:MAG: hypothetical protein KDB00_09800 [Planctomycetales bacterium]|nr:hypothetical protein [Planctomycetales bacterium]
MVQFAAFFLYLYAGFGVVNSHLGQRHAWFAFCFTGVFYLSMPTTLSWSLTGQIINDLREILHSQEVGGGGIILFDDWIGWFESIAVIGIALVYSMVAFIAVSVLERNKGACCQKNHPNVLNDDLRDSMDRKQHVFDRA